MDLFWRFYFRRQVRRQASHLLLQWLHRTARLGAATAAVGHVSGAMVHCAAAVVWDTPGQSDVVDLDFAKSVSLNLEHCH